MWHEARKQERIIRGMIVDYRRRAERRKDFYEKIKADPTQFLQVHGRPCKIHLDPAVAAAGEGPAIMMPWQGDSNNLIDRFDVRAHLDFIQEVKNPDIPSEDLNTEERQCNYERYRILAQNAFLGISEEKFLHQLAIEEKFGVTAEEKEAQKEKQNEKKGTGAAIGFNYNDPGAQPTASYGTTEVTKEEKVEDSDDDSDLEVIDVDLSIDVNKMEPSQAHELNSFGAQYGMAGCDMFSFLTGDADDAEHQKQLLIEEKEKAMFSGRKSRRERRAHRDKKMALRPISPPSYAAPSQEKARPKSPSRSASRSPSPQYEDNIRFITSFGGDEEEPKPPPLPKPLYADKVKKNLKPTYSEVARKQKRDRSSSPADNARPVMGPHRRDSRSRSRSRSQSRSRSRSRSRLRSRSRSKRHSFTRSKSRSRSRRSYSRSRSKSSSPRRYRLRSYSRSRSASSRSRSRSFSPRRSRSISRSRSRSYPRSYRRRSRSPIDNRSKQNDTRSVPQQSNEGSVSKSVPRYYGRRKEDKSSSELSEDSDSSGSDKRGSKKSALGNKSNSIQKQTRLSGSSSKMAASSSRETLSAKEKLKKKMQAQLARQLRADKRAEAERVERENRRQMRREEEMRELAIKLRRKQREMRHQYIRSSESDRSRSGSSSRDRSPKSDKQKSPKDRSRSESPKPIPVIESCKPINEPVFKPRHPNDKPRYDGGEGSSYQPPRRYPEHPGYEYDDRRKFHERPRYEAYQNRDNERNYERRDSNQYPQRRPYGHRGGYTGYGHRPYGRDGPSNWEKSEDRGSDETPKVKLVDY